VRQVRLSKAQELESDAKSYRQTAASMPELMEIALRNAALLEAQARALRGAGR
jgi:hypothetical protein